MKYFFITLILYLKGVRCGKYYKMRKLKPIFHLGIALLFIISLITGYIRNDWKIPKNTAMSIIILYGVTIGFKKSKRL